MRPRGVTPRSLHTHAIEHFGATEALYASKKVTPLRLDFLWGRAIELVLKSHSLSEDVAPARLRSKEFGHNLQALSEKASRRDIDAVVGAGPADRAIVHAVNLDYVTKRLEYRESDAMYLVPDAKLTRTSIKRPPKGVDPYLRTTHCV